MYSWPSHSVPSPFCSIRGTQSPWTSVSAARRTRNISSPSHICGHSRAANRSGIFHNMNPPDQILLSTKTINPNKVHVIRSQRVASTHLAPCCFASLATLGRYEVLSPIMYKHLNAMHSREQHISSSRKGYGEKSGIVKRSRLTLLPEKYSIHYVHWKSICGVDTFDSRVFQQW